MHKCLLCDSKSSELYVQVKRREYFLCNQCGLIYVPSLQHVSVVEEKKHYDQHENTPYDLNYRKFLSALSDPLSKRVEPPAVGLDFGSGSGIGRALAIKMASLGAKVHLLGLKEDRLEDVAELITNEGGVSEFLHVDVSDYPAG